MNAVLSSTEFIAAIFGAIVGGAIALLAQIIALRDARRARTNDAFGRQQSVGYALFYRLYQISSDLNRYSSHVATRVEKAKETRAPLGSWQHLTGIVNGPTGVTFNSEEAMLLLQLNENEAFQSLMSIDRLHSSTVKVWDAYAAGRASVLRKIPADIVENVATYNLSGEMRRTLSPQISEIQSLADSLIQRADSDAKAADTALRLTMSALNRHLRLDLRIDAGPEALIAAATSQSG